MTSKKVSVTIETITIENIPFIRCDKKMKEYVKEDLKCPFYKKEIELLRRKYD